MVKKGLRLLRNIILILGVLGIAYVALMCLAFAIPNKYINPQVVSSLQIIDSEGTYPKVGSFGNSARLDNFTDRLMISKANLENEGSVFVKAMIPSYSRYWHGYQIVLRPLLSLFTYNQIRYIGMFSFFLLAAIIFHLLCKKVSFFSATAFFISLIAGFAIIIPLSIQFSIIYYLMFAHVIVLLLFYEKLKKNKLIPYTFLIAGSLASFFDLLTTPIISLGIPLIIFLLLESKSKTSLKENFFTTIGYSSMWSVGYVLNWITKWAVGSLILKENIFANALESFSFRTTGNEEYPLSRANALFLNFERYFSKEVIVFLICFLIVWLTCLIIFKKNIRRQISLLIPLFIIGIYPYIWYIFAANHSQIHAWFTYRIQTVTLFSILIGMGTMLEFTNTKK